MNTKTYRTISGDTWDMIAYKKLGDELYKTAFIEANLEHKSVYIFPAGVVLNIPEIEVVTPSGLPPWKA